MKNKGNLLVLSGPSGVGKGTVVMRLLEKDENLVLSVSATTRQKREGEEDGVHYFFVSKEEFERKIENGEMLEFTQYNGNYYGTIRSYVEKFIQNGKTVLLEIEVDGASQIKKKIPQAVTVFLTAPSEEEVERRLRKRNTESEEAILKRLAIAKSEMAHASEYDYVVCNDDVENAADRILNILSNTNN